MKEAQALNEYSKHLNFELEIELNPHTRNVRNAELLTDYFNELYSERNSLEEKLLDNIKNQDNSILMVTGVEGAGKSSLVRKVCSELPNSIMPVLLNCREHISELNTIKPAELEAFVEEKLLDALFLEFLNPTRLHEYYSEDELCESILFDDDFAGTFRDIKLDFRELYLEVYKNSSTEYTSDNMRKWYKNDNKNVQDKLLPLKIKICRKITPFFFLRFISKKSEEKQICIILDNVDRLDKHQQQRYFSCIATLNKAVDVLPNIKFVICIRKENAREVTSFENQIEEIMLTASLASPGNYVLTSKLFAEILSKRVIYAIHRILNGDVSRIMLKIFHEFIQHDWLIQQLLNLSNRSIRMALSFYKEFSLLIYNKKMSDEDLEKVLNPTSLRSLMLEHVITIEELYQQQALDLPTIIFTSEANKYTENCCDLAYVLLVFLARHDNGTSLKNLFSKLKGIGFSEDDVRAKIEALYNLKNLGTRFGHVIELEIQPGKQLLSEDNIIRINFRGHVLVESIATSFTFTDLLLYKNYKDFCQHTDAYQNYHLNRNYGACSKNVLRFLGYVAFAHLIELIRIAQRAGKQNWLRHYKTEFSIGRELQLIRILKSHKGFLDSVREELGVSELSNIIKLYNKLEESFINELESLSKDTSEVIDYREIEQEWLAPSQPKQLPKINISNLI